MEQWFLGDRCLISGMGHCCCNLVTLTGYPVGGLWRNTESIPPSGETSFPGQAIEHKAGVRGLHFVFLLLQLFLSSNRISWLNVFIISEYVLDGPLN